jgi:hypothetical protein
MNRLGYFEPKLGAASNQPLSIPQTLYVCAGSLRCGRPWSLRFLLVCAVPARWPVCSEPGQRSARHLPGHRSSFARPGACVACRAGLAVTNSRFDIAFLKRRRHDNVARNANRMAELATLFDRLPDISYTTRRILRGKSVLPLVAGVVESGICRRTSASINVRRADRYFPARGSKLPWRTGKAEARSRFIAFTTDWSPCA